MNSDRAAVVFFSAVLLAVSPCAFATTSTWLGSTGNWADPLNWSTLPATNSDAVIDNGGTAVIGSNVTTGTITAGVNASGNIQQNSGTVGATSVTLGSATGTGTYTLNGGTLNAPVTVKSGTFSMSGGTASLGCTIQAGSNATITGGLLGWDATNGWPSIITSAVVTVAGTATQDGGTVCGSSGQNLWDTNHPGVSISGSYQLKSGQLSTMYNMQICSSSGPAAELVQTGGSVQAMTPLYPAPPNYYNYSDNGFIQVGDSYLTTAAGRYTISGGSVRTFYLSLGGWYSTSSGTLSITNNSADIDITGELMILPGGAIHAVPGTVFHFVAPQGSVFNSTTEHGYVWNMGRPEGTADLINVTYDFECGNYVVQAQGQRHTPALQITGFDKGASDVGFQENYAVGSIVVGKDTPSTVALFQGSTFGLAPTNAQYVENVVIGAGSTLGIYGGKLYYYNLTNLGGTIILQGGSLVQVFHRGDFNQDGRVDDADYTIWADYYQKSPPAEYQVGKDSSGGYNDADYTSWADHFNGGITNVPEPASLSLMALGMLALRRRRK